MKSVQAKKSFGQHFLKDIAVAEKIARTALQHSCSAMLEIGPGMGMLTQHLVGKVDEFKVVEIDNDSVDYLLSHAVVPASSIIHADFLKIDIVRIFSGKDFCVVGNFPYNISSQIVFKIIEHRQIIPAMTGMFQKEVAQRICSASGSKVYGILSVLVQAFYSATYHFTLDEHEFIPPPKVKSAVISLHRKENMSLACNEELFVKVVKTAFNQRRKTMNNSLKPILKDAKLPQQFGLLRPEQLSVEQFVELTLLIESLL